MRTNNNLKEINKLRTLEARVKKVAKKAELKVCALIANDAKATVHKRSGNLANSIGTEQTETTTTVFAGASYAAYEEFGTGPLVKVPQGLDEEAMKFFVNGKGNQNPHPYFFPAVFRHRDKLIPMIENDLQSK